MTDHNDGYIDTSSSNPDFATNPEAAADGVRLQTVLSAAGVASRRVSEEMISSGRVRVNGS